MNRALYIAAPLLLLAAGLAAGTAIAAGPHAGPGVVVPAPCDPAARSAAAAVPAGAEQAAMVLPNWPAPRTPDLLYADARTAGPRLDPAAA